MSGEPGQAPIDIEVDEPLCVSAGECEHGAPNTFEIGPDEVSRVIGVDEADLETILRAAGRCPSSAITVLRDGVRKEL